MALDRVSRIARGGGRGFVEVTEVCDLCTCPPAPSTQNDRTASLPEAPGPALAPAPLRAHAGPSGAGAAGAGTPPCPGEASFF